MRDSFSVIENCVFIPQQVIHCEESKSGKITYCQKAEGLVPSKSEYTCAAWQSRVYDYPIAINKLMV